MRISKSRQLIRALTATPGTSAQQVSKIFQIINALRNIRRGRGSALDVLVEAHAKVACGAWVCRGTRNHNTGHFRVREVLRDIGSIGAVAEAGQFQVGIRLSAQQSTSWGFRESRLRWRGAGCAALSWRDFRGCNLQTGKHICLYS